jgi:AP-1 complex subunit gamma-1
VAAVADKFAPSRRWHIDTLVSLLGASADTAKRPVLSMTLFLITHTPDEHAALTHKLFSLAATALASSGTAENSQQLLQVRGARLTACDC